MEANYAHADGRTLHCDGNLYDRWDTYRYLEHPVPAVRAEMYAFLEPAQKCVKRGDTEMYVPFAPNQTSINHAIDALQSLVYVGHQQPCWLCDAAGLPNPAEVIATPSGLVELRTDSTAKLFSPPTPLFYSRNALDFSYAPHAPEPLEWLRFLDQLWPEDREAIEALQEWFGYCLTWDARQQKALLLVGPKRAGKGTIARILTRLLGTSNVCGPTLHGLSTPFGLWGLIGKLLAIVSDARLSGRTDQAIITERLLALTGEDAIEIHRKNLAPVTLRLLVKIMILTNELPKLTDASGALASRFIVLTLQESFLGREDHGLEDRLCGELPGILNWAIAGWQRLRHRGRFVQPTTSKDAIEELNDLSSPIAAFVRDWCNVRKGECVTYRDLYDAWCCWCCENGRDAPGDAARFGRDLRATAPGVGSRQPKSDDGSRFRQYEGIDLSLSAKESLVRWRCRE